MNIVYNFKTNGIMYMNIIRLNKGIKNNEIKNLRKIRSN